MADLYKDHPTADSIALRDPTGALWPHVLLLLLQIVAFAGPDFRGRRTVFATAIIGTFVWSQLDPHVYNDLQSAQPLSIEWANMLSSLEKLLFSNPTPEACLYHVDRPAGEASSMRAFGFDKLRWAFVILINLRGIRWNYQVKNVPPVTYGTRRQWLRRQLFLFLYYLFMVDLVSSLNLRLFYTWPDGSGGRTPVKLGHSDPRFSFAKAFVFGATPYYLLSMQYTLFGFLTVLIGISKPEDWPAHFGFISDASTVRAFWGKYWHQTLRKSLTAFSGALVDGLGIRRGTNLSSYTQLWFSFLLSGIMHANGMRALPRTVTTSAQDLMRGWILFFVWQAAAITFEDFVQWLWRKSSSDPARYESFKRVVGYVWVTCTIWASLPLIGDIMLGLRVNEEPFLPFSVVAPFMPYVPIPP